MNKENAPGSQLFVIEELLANSEVFPKHIQELLINSLSSMTSEQLDLLLEILKEEREKFDELDSSH